MPSSMLDNGELAVLSSVDRAQLNKIPYSLGNREFLY